MTTNLDSKCDYVLDSDNKESNRNPTERRDKITFLIVFLFIVFITETVVRWPLYNLSIQIMKYVDPGKSWCNILEYMAYPEFYEGKMFFLLVVINFKNEYAGIIFLCLTEFSTFINGILKLFYLQPRPFWIDSGLTPCKCFDNYGNPSTTAINAISIFLGMNRIFRDKTAGFSRYNVILGIACLLGLTSTCASRFFGHVHTLNQLFFGFCIGYSIYYFVFEIMEVNLDSKSSFKKFFLSGNTRNFLISVFFINIIVNLIHYLLKFQMNADWLAVLLKYCDYIPFNLFDNESYQKSFSVYLVFAVFIGMNLDYMIVFKSNFDNYYDYTNNTKKNLKWNDTSLIKTFSRIIFTIITIHFISSNIFSLGDIRNDSFIKLLIEKFVLSNALVGIYTYFIVKLILKFVGLTNEKINSKNEFLTLDEKLQS